MRPYILCICTFIFAFSVFAQKPDDALATSSLRSFTVRDLSPEAQKSHRDLPATMANVRKQLVSQMLSEMLFEAEARSKNITVAKLIDDEMAKVPVPTRAQINAVYEANRAALGNKTLQESTRQIVEFLRREPEEKALKAYADTLAAKYKAVFGKDVNDPALKPMESLFTVNDKSVSAGEFEGKYKILLFETKANLIDDVIDDLETNILNALIAEEARSENIDPSAFIGREITNKMREFSDGERADLQNALKKRLFAKYQVKILLRTPDPVVQNISPDDDPAQGPKTAPVTVVMFSDFQCSACARTHPVLKKVLAEYGDKVRFVVRDFPLENIHENAFAAAVAANAALRQSKFFEYTEMLYGNQETLDAASLKKYAADIGLNAKQFELDLSDEKIAAEIRKDIADGKSYGITGTPSIFVNGVKVRHLSAESFRTAIENSLKR